jgi:two-component system osmolarity sensor histidine kinase EnvZ
VRANLGAQAERVCFDLKDEETQCDAVDLERILANLIDNAPQHGCPPVRVEVGIDAGRLRLCVIDQGPGMDTQEFIQARKPYVRLDDSRQRQGHCGLGLAIIEEIIARRGGSWAGTRDERGYAIVCWLPLTRVRPISGRA